MTMTDFIPELVLANMVLRARKNLVAALFCNTTVGIELKEKGSKIKINTLGDVTSADTNEATPMTYGDVDSAGEDLEITLDKTVSVKLKDKEKQQIAASGQQLEAAVAARMVYQLNNDVDALVMGKYGDCDLNSYESGSTAWQWGTAGADVPNFFAALHKTMDDALCEKEGRFVALPNIAIQAIRIYLAGKATPFGDEVITQGLAFDRAIFGFWIFQSPNCVEASSVIHGIAGNLPNIGEGIPGGMALAIQISPTVEKLRLEGFWADGLRSRVTAGALVFKPDRMVNVHLNATLLA
jgi:hypothetical protein